MSGRLIVRLCWFVAVIIVAGGAQAQTEPHFSVTAHWIDVTLTGSACGNVSRLSMVLNGNDREAFALDKDPATLCHWTKKYDEGFYLRPKPAYFSLRLGGARSECRNAIEIPRPGGEPAGQLKFRVTPNNARDVNVHAGSGSEEPVLVRYVRHVKKDRTASGSIRCEEHGLLDEAGPQPISDVNFGREDLRLQFLTTEQLDVPDPGLLVNDEAVLKTRTKGSRVVLRQRQVLDALADQIVRGKRAVPPGDPPNWRESDKKMLAAAGVQLLEITVP